VFAGEGINKLRRYLTDLLNSITEEMNSQGDDDVGDSVSYVHDDDSMDLDDVPPQVAFSRPIVEEQSPISAPPSSLATIRPPRRPNGHVNHHPSPHQPIVRLNGTSAREAEMSTLRIERPSSSRNSTSRSTTRSPTHSPPPAFNPTQGPSRWNAAEKLPTSPAGSEGSSAGAFFRTYQSSSADGRPNGALTPDLNFAEIGHGQGPAGWHGQEQNQNHANHHVDSTMLNGDDRHGGNARRSTTQAAVVGQGPFGTNGAFHAHTVNGNMNGTYHTNGAHSSTTNGATSYGINGTGAPPVMIQGPPMTREERSRGRQRTSREPQESTQPPATRGQSQGRGPKRILRNTLNSVEQHASSFFFGRPLQDGEGSSASATARKDDSARGY
jgi:F-box and leucine-rich repeat protein GRR1